MNKLSPRCYIKVMVSRITAKSPCTADKVAFCLALVKNINPIIFNFQYLINHFFIKAVKKVFRNKDGYIKTKYNIIIVDNEKNF